MERQAGRTGTAVLCPYEEVPEGKHKTRGAFAAPFVPQGKQGKQAPHIKDSFDEELAGKLVFAEFFEAVAEAALKRSGRIGIEGDEIPERLAAIFA